MPGGVERRVHADPVAGFTAVVAAAAGALASAPGRDAVVPDWVA